MSIRTTGYLVVLALIVAPLAACESLPGDESDQGAVIGGIAGGAAGAAIAENNRLLGALIGAAAGAGGGYLIGSEIEKADADDDDVEDAREAARTASNDPADADDVDDSNTADLNEDGFVTIDEVLAMEAAGLSDAEMLDRLENTYQVFELTTEQEQYLIDRGVSRYVVREMENINREERDRILRDRISR